MEQTVQPETRLWHNIRIGLFSSFLILLYACQEGTVYHTYLPVSPEGWYRQDTLWFVIPPTNEKGNYQLNIGIRNSDVYPYRDLWMEISLGKQKDTLHLYLANKQGRWNGGGTSGSLYQYEQTYKTIQPDNKKADTLYIIHLMNENPLHGITDIGVKLSKISPSLVPPARINTQENEQKNGETP